MQFRTAGIVVLLLAFIFGIVQVFFHKSWLMGIFVFISIVGAIASGVFLFVDPQKRLKKPRRFRLFQ
jgi:membrane protein YdbS with pleckstrin-like domain